MAAKKKPASAADFRKKEEADKAKAKGTTSSPTFNGKTVNWDKPGTRKPTEAITNVGQKATGLAKPVVKDRFASTAKTPVRNDISGATLRGSGTPLGASFGINPMNKSQIANAALTVVSAPSIGGRAVGPITSAVTKKVEKYVGGKALPVLAKGLDASGAGGKIKNVITPMGKTIASTRIGTPAQQSAQMGNLMKGAIGKTGQISGAISSDIARGMNAAGKVVKTGAAGALLANAMAPKPKKKK